MYRCNIPQFFMSRSTQFLLAFCMVDSVLLQQQGTLYLSSKFRKNFLPLVTPHLVVAKVIIKKSRGEVSLMEQETLENVSQPIKIKTHFQNCHRFLNTSKCAANYVIPTQDKNQPKAGLCPSGFIIFCLPKILHTYHITQGVVNFPKIRTKSSSLQPNFFWLLADLFLSDLLFASDEQ